MGKEARSCSRQSSGVCLEQTTRGLDSFPGRARVLALQGQRHLQSSYTPPPFFGFKSAAPFCV